MHYPTRALWAALGLIVLTACVGPLERESDEASAPADQAQDPGTAAVISLIEQSRLAYEHGDYNNAIQAAERGLRIDRREPELYLVLAQSYLELAQPAQATQFAQQGLRHSLPDSRLYQALEDVKRRSEQNSNTLRF